MTRLARGSTFRFVCAACYGLQSGASFAQGLQTVTRPAAPFIERRDDQRIVNFDLLVENRSPEPYRLVAIKLAVYDHAGKLQLARELNENGHPPALDTIGARVLQPAAVLDIFQPFYTFGQDIDLARMHFELLFVAADAPSVPVVLTPERVVSIDLHPKEFDPPRYCLPMNGLVLVHDGHDFYSHHRRYNLTARYQSDPDSAVAANLFAYDFMRAAPDGALVRGDFHQKEHWLSYGEPVFAPADGIIVAAVSNVPENEFDVAGDARQPADGKTADPDGLGNHVEIRHSDGRVSWLLHLQPGSLRVETGDRVHAGQLLGKVGFSGDSLFPHLHYNVTDGATYPSQGVPSYFRSFVRVLGTRRHRATSGQVDTGDLIESDSACR